MRGQPVKRGLYFFFPSTQEKEGWAFAELGNESGRTVTTARMR